MNEPYHCYKLTPEQEAELAELIAIDEATRPASDALIQAAEEAEAAAKEAAADQRYAEREAASYAWQKRQGANQPGQGSGGYRPGLGLLSLAEGVAGFCGRRCGRRCRVRRTGLTGSRVRRGRSGVGSSVSRTGGGAAGAGGCAAAVDGSGDG